MDLRYEVRVRMQREYTQEARQEVNREVNRQKRKVRNLEHKRDFLDKIERHLKNIEEKKSCKVDIINGKIKVKVFTDDMTEEVEALLDAAEWDEEEINFREEGRDSYTISCYAIALKKDSF